jgi:carbonic anhydrase|uniref:Carbonic anhydrase n=1 Tax=Desulfobacca acetoxidans TaxID=60893 RepID=A0A7C3Z924_9BACT
MAFAGPGLTAQEVWRLLLEGNMRFVQGLFMGRNLLDLRKSLTRGQMPMAAVLCCSDSRVPAEIVFDQSLGDLFVVRTAGLVLEPTSLGSLEYAVAHLHVPLLVIKGHESCGAVTAAVTHPDLDEGHITAVVRKIAPAVSRAQESGLTGKDLVEKANNIHLAAIYDTMKRESPIIGEALAARRLHMVVAKYSLSAGQVEVLDTTL